MTDDAETDEQQDHLNDASFDLIIDSASYREKISVQPSRRSILVSGTITNIFSWSESWSSTPVVRSMLFSGSIQIGEEAYLPGSHSVKVSTGDRATQTEPSSLGCLSYACITGQLGRAAPQKPAQRRIGGLSRQSEGAMLNAETAKARPRLVRTRGSSLLR